MKKTVFLFLVIVSSSFGTIWSTTSMSIATGMLNSSINSGMSVVKSRVDSLKSAYDDVKAQVKIKAALTADIQKLDVAIDKELMIYSSLMGERVELAKRKK